MALLLKRTTFLSLLLTALFLPNVAFSDNPRVVITKTGKETPPVDEVIEILKKHLVDTEIDVGVHSVEGIPATTDKWVQEAKRAARSKPGTILLLGYTCKEKKCRLTGVSPESEGVVTVPVLVPDHGDLTTAFALAATSRETFLGPLVPELGRLARQGANPSPPPPSPDTLFLKPPLDDARKSRGDVRRPWFWIEGGYQGDQPHPSGVPVHGFVLGASVETRRTVGLNVGVGWLGVRNSEFGKWSLTVHRLTAQAAIRIIFPLGPARVSIAPLVRLDTVFSTLNDTVFVTEDKNTDLEIQVGGHTTWHLPISEHLEAVVGAGLLFSALSEEYEADEIVLLPATNLRFLWTAGLAWSPVKK